MSDRLECLGNDYLTDTMQKTLEGELAQTLCQHMQMMCTGARERPVKRSSRPRD